MSHVDLRRAQGAFWLEIALVFVCILGVGQVEAATVPTVEICHFDTTEGVFKKLSINGNAVQWHLEQHGDLFPGSSNDEETIFLDDDCNEVVPPVVLARAYIDVNRNGSYEPSDDYEIATLIDDSAAPDNIPSPGDKVLLSQYPETFDPCPLPDMTCEFVGLFNPPAPILVSAVNPFTAERIRVTSQTGDTYTWSEGGDGIELFTIIQNGGLVVIRDSTLNFLFDQILISPTGDEINPSSNPEDTQLVSTDDYFMNVEVLVTP